MKKTLKSILVIALVALSMNVNAQSVGIQAGYVSSTQTDNDAISGFQVGPTAELQIQGNFALQYGISYTYLSNKETVLGTDINYTGHFIDVPVRLKASFPISSDLSLFAFGGPNFQIGIAENVKTFTQIGSTDFETNTNLYKMDEDEDNKNDLDRLNLQLGVGGGVQFKSVQLKVGYDWGLFDLNKMEDVNMKRSQLTASIGYMF